MNESSARFVLRAAGIAIAIAAIVDPAITTRRAVRPVVQLIADDSARDAGLVDRVARAIDERFTVARSPIASASATIVVGDRIPRAAAETPGPAFVVAHDSTLPSVTIERIDVPSVVPADARVPVSALVASRGAAGQSLELTLRAGGFVVNRTAIRAVRRDTTFTARLSFVPTAIGATPVRLTVALGGSDVSAIADAVVTVRDKRWTVLFYEARPSWTSTFVRRAIERDSRFTVSSRVVTSRGVGNSSGSAPRSLGDRERVSSFDAIVVGAPDALTAADVAGLEAFMRQRGGSVVLLLDGLTSGPHDRLVGVSDWRSSSNTAFAAGLTQDDSASLRTSETMWPTALPLGATTIVRGDRPVVWETPTGAGRLIVSGALDAWRLRDPAASGFERFWRTVIAGAANAAPPPLVVTVSPPVALPGETVDVGVVVRDAAISPSRAGSGGTVSRASVGAMLEPSTAVRLWPEADVGHLRGSVRAPREPGTYRITVAGEDQSVFVPLVVAGDARDERSWSPQLLHAWAASRGGDLVQGADAGRLVELLSAAVRPPSSLVTWHPLRSAWWIVPFVLVLSGEWWLRRRRGLR